MVTNRLNIYGVMIVSLFNFAMEGGCKRVRLSLAPPALIPYNPCLFWLLAIRNKAKTLFFTPFVTAKKWSKWLLILFVTGCVTTPPSLEQVNYEINRYPYVSDMDNYGKDKYFATPVEFYKNGGDCEDYAIAKRYELSKLGYTGMKYITVTLPEGPDHVVLFVEGKILDNRSRHIEDLDYLKREYTDIRPFIDSHIMEAVWFKD